MRWVRAEHRQKQAGKPKWRTPEELAALVVRVVTDVAASLECRRTLGDSRKLGILKMSRSKAQNILRGHRIALAPLRPRFARKEFIERHKETLHACDFHAKEA